MSQLSNSLKLNLEYIKIKNNKSLMYDDVFNSYLILNEINNSIHESSEFRFAKYHSHIKFEEKFYEGIIFSPDIDLNIIENFFNIVAFDKKNLPNTIDDINSVFKNAINKFSNENKRGIFAELYCLYKFSNLRPKTNINSTYDMVDEKGRDVEIKSYSIIKNEVIFSLNQLLINKLAELIIVPIDESANDGISIYEMYKKIPLINKRRYEYIEDNNSFFTEDKYFVLEDKIIFTNILEIAEDIILPSYVKNAKFTIDLSFLHQKIIC